MSIRDSRLVTMYFWIWNCCYDFFVNFCLSVSVVLSLMLVVGIRSSDGFCEVML